MGGAMKCPVCYTELRRENSSVGPLDYCPRCHTGRKARDVEPPPVPIPPALGIDPGVKMGLAVVGGGAVLSADAIDWHRPKAWERLEDAVKDAMADRGVTKAVIEILGPTRGEARGRATSWAVMSETAGRAVQECERQGLEVVRMTPGEWRKALGLPASFGEDKDKKAKEYALRLLGFDAPNPHVAEAALIAMAGGAQ